MFTIAGPVIVYGTVASVVYGMIYWFLRRSYRRKTKCAGVSDSCAQLLAGLRLIHRGDQDVVGAVGLKFGDVVVHAGDQLVVVFLGHGLIVQIAPRELLGEDLVETVSS